MFYYSPARVITVVALTQDVTVEHAFTQACPLVVIEEVIAEDVARYGECMVTYAIDGNVYKRERIAPLVIEEVTAEELALLIA